MPIDPELYFDLSTEELREVARFALAPVEAALGWLGAEPDPRVLAALEAARRFADGEPRSRLQRVTAPDAHRAGREASDPVAAHIAAAAGDAAASAYLHPFAKGEQVGHILRSTAHVALAAETATGDPAAVGRVIDEARARATSTLRSVLKRYPPYPVGRSSLARVIGELDEVLRAD